VEVSPVLYTAALSFVSSLSTFLRRSSALVGIQKGFPLAHLSGLMIKVVTLLVQTASASSPTPMFFFDIIR
jgi:hypothetical protein